MTKQLTDRNKDSIMDFRHIKYVSIYVRYPDFLIGPHIEVYTEKRQSPQDYWRKGLSFVLKEHILENRLDKVRLK